jgi:hypothetical protein
MGREGIEPPTRGFLVLGSEKHRTSADRAGIVVAALTRQGVVFNRLQLSGVWSQVWTQVLAPSEHPLRAERPWPWNRPDHEGASLPRWQMRVGVPRSQNKNSGVGKCRPQMACGWREALVRANSGAVTELGPASWRPRPGLNTCVRLSAISRPGSRRCTTASGSSPRPPTSLPKRRRYIYPDIEPASGAQRTS